MSSEDSQDKFLRFAMIGVGGLAGIVVLGLVASIVFGGKGNQKQEIQPSAQIATPPPQPKANELAPEVQPPLPAAIQPLPPVANDPPPPPARPETTNALAVTGRLSSLDRAIASLLDELSAKPTTMQNLVDKFKLVQTEIVSLGKAQGIQETAVHDTFASLQQGMMDYERIDNASKVTRQKALPELEASYNKMLDLRLNNAKAIQSEEKDKVAGVDKQLAELSLLIAALKRGCILYPDGKSTAERHGIEYIESKLVANKAEMLGANAEETIRAKCVSLCIKARSQIQEAN